jgi:hypothetical protein
LLGNKNPKWKIIKKKKKNEKKIILFLEESGGVPERNWGFVEALYWEES